MPRASLNPKRIKALYEGSRWFADGQHRGARSPLGVHRGQRPRHRSPPRCSRHRGHSVAPGPLARPVRAGRKVAMAGSFGALHPSTGSFYGKDRGPHMDRHLPRARRRHRAGTALRGQRRNSSLGIATGSRRSSSAASLRARASSIRSNSWWKRSPWRRRPAPRGRGNRAAAPGIRGMRAGFLSGDDPGVVLLAGRSGQNADRGPGERRHAAACLCARSRSSAASWSTSGSSAMGPRTKRCT